MTKIHQLVVWLSGKFQRFRSFLVTHWQPSPKNKQALEIRDWNAKYYDDPDQDPQRVYDRQFANTIRSGRG
jgi:hypothetical protein